jgi:hypothetical protein
LSDTAWIERLEADGVLRATGGTLELTDEFRERSARRVEAVETLDGSLIEEYVDLDDESRWVRRAAVAYLEALRTFDVGFTEEELVTVAIALVRTQDPAAGASNGSFFRLRGDELPGFLETSGAAIVLVSKPDCEPCDRIRTKVETLVDDGTIPADLPLVEVSGPEHPQFLREEYDVVGAPTLLLCKHGRVDLRLVGSKHIKQIRSDVERTYSEPADSD